MSPLDVATSAGAARVHLSGPAGGAAVVLGHGAGGGVEAPDLVAVRDRLRGAGVAVALVEQPYRVAGRRAPAPAGRLDAAFTECVAAAADRLAPRFLVVGGRSSGARVACRTATAAGAHAVLCLAFPLHPPGRPQASRAAELALPAVPVHVAQGERDPFGGPAEFPRLAGLALYPQPGADHSLRTAAAAVAELAVRVVQALAAAPAGAAVTESA